MELTSPTERAAGWADAQELFIQRGWGDGLPIVPPTPSLVERFIEGSGREPTEVVAVIAEQGREVTVEKIAVNAVVAGCRPEYMSVLLAAVRAVGTDEFNLHSTTVSGATAPLLIVSGPAVAQLAINSSFSVFGPGYVANATIGRAVRLILQNLCGGTPAIMDKATMGHPGKFSFCIGESIEHNPWPPVHADRGVPAGDSAVTVFSGEAPINARNDWADEPGPVLATIADAMVVSHFTGGGFVVVLGPQHAALLAGAGLARTDVREELFRRARRSIAELKRAGRRPGRPEPADETTSVPAVADPSEIVIVVAGGHLYGYSAVIPPWVGGHESRAVTEPVARENEVCHDQEAACPT